MKIAVVALALVVLSACAKSNQESSSSSASPPQISASAAVVQNGAEGNDGGKVYATNCASCHQPNGAGIEETFPPLANNPTVTGDATKLIYIVKYGVSGKMTVLGKNYNGMMPNWGQALSNADIASAITYIRSSWGNKASAVTEAQVAGVTQ